MHARALASKGEAWIAQRFVAQRPVPTPWGERLVTLGAYIADGHFAGQPVATGYHETISHPCQSSDALSACQSARSSTSTVS